MKNFIIFVFAIPAFNASALIQNFTPETNDRFANSSEFIADDFDLSGVGRTSGGSWATLIGPNIFVSANHYHPRVGSSVTFFGENDPSGPSFSYPVAGTSRIANSDLLIGHFADAVDASLTSYSWESSVLDSVTFAESLQGSHAFLLGQSPQSSLYSSKVTNTTVGENEVSIFLSDLSLSSLGVGDFLITSYSNSAEAYLHEAQLSVGDSGSPLFLNSGGELSVAGIATAKSSSYSYYTYSGTSVAEVESYIQLNGVNPVPEPSVSLLLTVVISVAWRRRRV